MTERTASRARVYVVDISHSVTYRVSAQTLIEEFGAEWDEAQSRGLDEDAFVRETVEIMRGYLGESPELYERVDEDYECLVYRVPEGDASAPPGSAGAEGAT